MPCREFAPSRETAISRPLTFAPLVNECALRGSTVRGRAHQPSFPKILARCLRARLGAPAAGLRTSAFARAFATGEPHPAAKYRTEDKEWIPVKYLIFNRYEVIADRWRKYKSWVGALAVIGGGAFAWDMYRSRQPAIVANNLVAAFEKGYVPDDEEKDDDAATLLRPALHTQLAELLRPAAIKGYALVVGAHGTGKVSGCSQPYLRRAADYQCGGSTCSDLLLTSMLTNHAHSLAVHGRAQGGARDACGWTQRRRVLQRQGHARLQHEALQHPGL